MEKILHAIAAAFMTWALLLPVNAQADSGADHAWSALRAGEVLPLSSILQAVHRDFAGDVIEIELERDDGMWKYKIKLLSPQGAVVKLEYDARTATLLKAKGAGVEAARRSR